MPRFFFSVKLIYSSFGNISIIFSLFFTISPCRYHSVLILGKAQTARQAESDYLSDERIIKMNRKKVMRQKTRCMTFFLFWKNYLMITGVFPCSPPLGAAKRISAPFLISGKLALVFSAESISFTLLYSTPIALQSFADVSPAMTL